MTREYRNLQGENYTKTMEYMKNHGYKFVVTYNNTSEFLYFIDRFFKNENSAKKFYEKIKHCGKCDFKTL